MNDDDNFDDVPHDATYWRHWIYWRIRRLGGGLLTFAFVIGMIGLAFEGYSAAVMVGSISALVIGIAILVYRSRSKK